MLSFALLTATFLSFCHFCGLTVEESCSRVSQLHHFIAMCLGLWAHWQYSDHIALDASFGQNTDYPLAVILQHFNIGYFLYDTIHVAVWDQKFFVHHLIAIAGYTSSELANVFGLANAVNTWITEVGSLLYSTYLVVRSERAYIIFVIIYTLSRVYFAVWSISVFRQVWHAAFVDNGPKKYPVWAPACAGTLQVLLLIVNVTFVTTHWQKLLKRYMRKSARTD